MEALAFFFVIFCGLMILMYFPVGLWVAAISSGVAISPMRLIFMRLRGVEQTQVIRPLIQGKKAGIPLDIELLEAHYLAGGNVGLVVNAIVSANKAGIELGFNEAAAIDLAGRNVFQAVQNSVKPKVISTPLVSAMARDGIQVKATARVTVRVKIKNLVGGAGEETILARVGEGICTTVGSAESHKSVLENPDMISEMIMKKGLDANTAYDIISVDIADVDVGKNIGSQLQIDQAEADKQVAQAEAEKRRSMAQAQYQENVADAQAMRAKVVEMEAKIKEAEATVPLAIAEAFRKGHLGIKQGKRPAPTGSEDAMRKRFSLSQSK